jgi:cytoskeleton protein RodZ
MSSIGINTIGRLLEAAREEAGLSRNQLAMTTRIRPSALEALEEGNFEALPAPVFVRGFIRAYCREVGLDPADVLTRYGDYLHEKSVNTPDEETPRLGTLLVPSADMPSKSHRGLQLSHVLLLLLALVTFIIAYVTAGAPTAPQQTDEARTNQKSGQSTSSTQNSR